MSSRLSEKFRLPLCVKMRSFTELPMAVIFVCVPLVGPLIVSEFCPTGIAPEVSVIVLHADVSIVALLPAVAMMPRSVFGPVSPQSVTLMATQLIGAASAKTLAMHAAIGLRRSTAREIESDMGLSPRRLLAPRVYATSVERA